MINHSSTKKQVTTAVSQNGKALRFATLRLKSNQTIVMAALSQNGRALLGVYHLQSDQDIVMAAVSQNGRALLGVYHLQSDQDIVMAAVRQKGRALEYAHPRLQADRELVLAAVSQVGGVLRLVAPKLQSDQAIVMAAVSQNGEALQYASNDLKANREVVLAAVNQESDALKHAHQNLREGGLAHFIKDMGAYVSFSRFGAIKKAGSIKPYHQIRVMSHILSFLTGVTMPKLGDILVRGEVRAVVGAEQILQARAVDARLRLTDSIPINKAPQDQSIIGCGCAIQ